MSRGYWSGFFAIGGFLAFSVITIGAWLLLQPREPTMPVYEGLQAENAHYRPGGSGCDPSRLRILGDKASDERDRCAEAEEEHRLKSNDLVQQTRAANAAETTSWLTYAQSRVMAFQTIAGIFTLFAAVYAAWYARQASIEARRGADAAEESVRQALETSHAQLSAYITCETQEVVHSPKAAEPYSAKLTLKNSGNTPAHDVDVTCTLTILAGGVSVPYKTTQFRNTTMGPGEGFYLEQPFSISPDTLKGIKNWKAKMIVNLEAMYADAFGRKWVYSLRMRITKRSLETGLIYTDSSTQRRITEDEISDGT